MNKLIEKIKQRISAKREYYYLNDDVYDTIAVDALDFACDVIEEEAKAYNEVKTNADYIRNMTDEELAELLENVRTHGFAELCCDDDLCDSDGCDYCVKAWLQAEREEK